MNTDMLRRIAALLASLILVGLVAAAEYYGRPISFSIFYLLPIFICVHNVGRWPGLALAVVCGATALFIDLNEDPHYFVNENHAFFVHPIVGVWNGLALTGVFVIFALLVASLEATLQRERRINKNLETLMTLSPADSRGWLAPGGSMPDSSPEIEQTPHEGLGQPGV